MGVLVGVELGGRDGRDAHLLDQEPGELEVAGPVGDVRREGVVLGEFNGGHVGEDEVAAFGVGVLMVEKLISIYLVVDRSGRVKVL